MGGVLLAPSILSADFSRLGEEVEAVTAAGADWIHLDVMDGRFVPNLTFGPPVVQALRRRTALPLDAHLMMVEPERYVEEFARAGADLITVHAEACPHLQRNVDQIKSLGKKAGVALNPGTSEDAIRYVAGMVDLVLVMTVSPGFGGQQFMRHVVPKIRRVRELLSTAGNPGARVEVDGGVAPDTALEVVQAGADVLVAGSAVFKGGQYRANLEALRRAATPSV